MSMKCFRFFLVAGCFVSIFWVDVSNVFAQGASKWPMFLPAITAQAVSPVSYWRVVTRTTCPTSLTFSVTVDGTTRESVMTPADILEGTYSAWAATTPGEKTIDWQITCAGYQSPPGWSGNVTDVFANKMNYYIVLSAGPGGQPVVTVEEREGIPAGANDAGGE